MTLSHGDGVLFFYCFYYLSQIKIRDVCILERIFTIKGNKLVFVIIIQVVSYLVFCQRVFAVADARVWHSFQCRFLLLLVIAHIHWLTNY